jgi:hypothetical protein
MSFRRTSALRSSSTETEVIEAIEILLEHDTAILIHGIYQEFASTSIICAAPVCG